MENNHLYKNESTQNHAYEDAHQLEHGSSDNTANCIDPSGDPGGTFGIPDQDAAYEAIVQREGEPYTQVKENGAVTLNHGCVAALVAHANNLIYDSQEEDFYKYNWSNGLWEKLTDVSIKHLIDQETREALNQANVPIRNSLTKTALDSILSHLRQRTEKQVSWNTERIIHVLNGMLDLSAKSPKLLPFSPDYMSRNQIPIRYDQEATCPRFINELLTTCLEEEDVYLLQRYLGSILLRANDAQVFLVIVGVAAGGKSTFVQLTELIIGGLNTCEIRTEHLDNRFESYNYLGKLLLTGKDVKGNFLQANGSYIIKKLVGDDFMRMEKKGSSEQIQMRASFNLILTSNSQLYVKFDGDSEAWKRRMLIVPWEAPKTKRKRIPRFAKVLLEQEGPGILNWMLKGVHDHLIELEIKGTFILTGNQARRVEDILNESDSVRAFIYGCIEKEEGSQIPTYRLSDAYFRKCEELEWGPKTVREFQNESPKLISERFNIRKSHDIHETKRGYRGLKLKS